MNTSTVSGELADVKYQSSLAGYENALSKAQRELEEAAESWRLSTNLWRWDCSLPREAGLSQKSVMKRGLPDEYRHAGRLCKGR